MTRTQLERISRRAVAVLVPVALLVEGAGVIGLIFYNSFSVLIAGFVLLFLALLLIVLDMAYDQWEGP